MNKLFTEYVARFNALTLRERFLFGGSILVAIGFIWWHFFAAPIVQQVSLQQEENNRISSEVKVSKSTVSNLRKRIASGVHSDKKIKLERLRQELVKVEDRLRLKTGELINPKDMFRLMTQLVYKESRLKLLSLKRREVKPAIEQNIEQGEEAGIYRHVLEVRFAGSYRDILTYMQSLEDLDWKLIWDEIEIVSKGHPELTVMVVISTLSTRREWVGV